MCEWLMAVMAWLQQLIAMLSGMFGVFPYPPVV